MSVYLENKFRLQIIGGNTCLDCNLNLNGIKKNYFLLVIKERDSN